MRVTAEQITALYAMRRAGRAWDMVTTDDGRLVTSAEDDKGVTRTWVISPQGKTDVVSPRPEVLLDAVCEVCGGEGYGTRVVGDQAFDEKCATCNGLGLKP